MSSAFDSPARTSLRVARSQDAIGWRNFMEGRISKEFLDIQHVHLGLGYHRINSEQWARQFISKALHITHGQWIFRNFTLHDKQKGWPRKKEMSEITEKIEFFWETDIDGIPKGSRFLLEMDPQICEKFWPAELANAFTHMA